MAQTKTEAAGLMCNKMNNKPLQLLNDWLSVRLSKEQLSWFDTQLDKISRSNSDRELHITLGMIPRKLDRADLYLTTRELTEADCLVTGWHPQNWSIDIAARVAVICHLANHRPDRFNETLIDLCRNADLAESIALYSGLPLYPQNSGLDELIGEGLRTNIRSVFEAIAHHSPYPANHFDDNRWNHMVLKALFIGSTLAPIYGLDKRANPELARILCDYANERRAAGRPVTHELWRCVGPFAKGDMIDDLALAANSDNHTEKQAALLALSAAPDSRAQTIITEHSVIANEIASGTLTWDAIQQQENTGKAA